jgi:hypothetical protein
VEPVKTYDRAFKPPAAVQAALLTDFENRCAYCRLPFGLLVWKRGVGTVRNGQYGATRYAAIALHVEWDHFIPFAYSATNRSDWFVPACQLCNNIKNDRIFRTIEGAREAIEPSWVKKYELASGPVLSWKEALEMDAS